MTGTARAGRAGAGTDEPGAPRSRARPRTAKGHLANLSGRLFPLADETNVPRPVIVVGYLAAMALLTAVALVRQSGVPATNTVWAEDGTLYYAQALQFSFWHNIFAPYNGYEQLVPRLLVELAARFPVPQASEVMAVSGAVTLAAICCCVFHMARGHVRPPVLRVLLAASVVLLPVATAELLDNTVNIPWWLYFAAFWAILWRPRSTAGRAVALVLCALAVASDPLVLLFAPLSALRALSLRSWREHASTIGLALGLVFQGLARIGVKETPFPASTVKDLGTDLAVRVGLGVVTGSRATNWVTAQGTTLATVLGALLFCAIVGVGLSRRRSRPFTVVAACLSVICFIVPVWLRGVSVVMNGPVSTGSRYDAVPVLILASILFVTASAAVEAAPGRAHSAAHARRLGRRRHLVTVLLLVVFLPAWVADFRDANARTVGPSWPAQVAGATASCRQVHQRLAALKIDPSPWVAVVPCRLLVAQGP